MKIHLPVTGLERAFPDDASIIFMTDLKGEVTYVNQEFIYISGFAEQELIGRSQSSSVRHPEKKKGQTWA